jgi:hypothetical protein
MLTARRNQFIRPSTPYNACGWQAERSDGSLRLEKGAGSAVTRLLSVGAFRTTYGPKYGRFRIRKRSRMGGDARIRLILNNGLEMARKAVKTAGKRHGGGLKDGERTLPWQLERTTAVEARGHRKIVEGIATVLLSQEVRGLYKCSRRGRWNITEVRRSLF